MKPKVLISVPNGDGWTHKIVTFTVMKMLQDPRVTSEYIAPTWSPYENNLHKIRLDFLAGGFDYWINIDSDNPPQNNPIDLCFLGLDIVGCVTPVWANMKPGDFPIYWNALDAVGDEGWKPHTPCVGLQEVDAIGSGCMVLSKQVMAVIPAPFQRIYHSDGTVNIGCDYAFCRRAKKLGFKVHAHYDYPCHHFNEIDLCEIIKAFTDYMKAHPNG